MGKAIESFHLDKFPIYSCAYLSQDQILLAGGGGGKTKAGLANKLVVYALGASGAASERRQVGERVLAEDEDAPAAVAVHGDLILAGINESDAARRAQKENHHLRTFRLDRKTETEVDTVTLRPGLSHEIMQLDLEQDDYQKQTRVSDDGQHAALLSAQGKAALVALDKVQRVPCPFLDERVETDAVVDLAFWHEVLLVATKRTLHGITLDSKAKDAEPKELFDLSRIRILSRYKLAHVAVFDKDRLVLGMNSADNKTSFVALYRIFKGELRQSHVKNLPSRIQGIRCDRLQGQQDSTSRRKIAVALGDGGLVLLDGRLEVLRRFRQLHAFPISAFAFAPNGQQLVTCSIDYKVNVLDLRSVGQVDVTRLLAVAAFLAVMLYLLSKLLL